MRVKAWVRSRGGGGVYPFEAGTALLVGGQTLQQDLDLQAILPGTVEGLVLLNGASFADANIALSAGGAPCNQRTDAEGRFTAQCAAGDYALSVRRPSRSESHLLLRSQERAVVVRGETVRQTFRLSSGTLAITLRDAAGKPVAGATVTAVCGDLAIALPPSGADGRIEAELPAEALELRILPQKYSTREAQQQLRTQATGGDPIAPLWITLATVTLAAGQTQDVELKLPADSGY